MSRELRLPVLLSIAAALVTIGLKFFAYWVSGSVGLFSDAIESLVNLLASCTALYCLWYAAQPVDADHTYGHEKIEYFSSGLEGSLILVAAGSIAWSAVERLLNPKPLEDLGDVVEQVVTLLLGRQGQGGRQRRPGTTQARQESRHLASGVAEHHLEVGNRQSPLGRLQDLGERQIGR